MLTIYSNFEEYIANSNYIMFNDSTYKNEIYDDFIYQDEYYDDFIYEE